MERKRRELTATFNALVDSKKEAYFLKEDIKILQGTIKNCISQERANCRSKQPQISNKTYEPCGVEMPKRSWNSILASFVFSPFNGSKSGPATSKRSMDQHEQEGVWIRSTHVTEDKVLNHIFEPTTFIILLLPYHIKGVYEDAKTLMEENQSEHF